MTDEQKELANWHQETDDNDVIWLCLDKHESSANVLSESVLREFERLVSGI